MDEQLPLFLEPAPPRRANPRPRRPPPVTPPRYSKVKARGKRLLCDDCCMEIHRLGQGLAPLPRRALWRRKSSDGPALLLCQAHKDERHDDESR